MGKKSKAQHLEFIQNIITRMNTNSFQIKGLCITLITGILAIYASTQKVIFVLLGIFPVILFWFLDAYYLQQERKFRGVYNDVSGLSKNNVINSYEMPIHKYKDGIYSYSDVFWSKTIKFLYLSIVILLMLICVTDFLYSNFFRDNINKDNKTKIENNMNINDLTNDSTCDK